MERLNLKSRSAFNLLELLGAMSIASVLMLLAIVAFQHVLGGSAVTRAGQLAVDQISRARQEAVGRNRPVEVRLIWLNSSSGCRAIQLCIPSRNDTTRWEPLGGMVTLPQGIVISENSVLSPLLANAPVPKTAATSTAGGSITYCGFHFLAGGGTDIPQNSGNNFITLASERQVTSDKPPANYSTVQVDSLNGQVRLFRP